MKPKKFHALDVNLVVTFNCRRTNMQKLEVQRFIQEAIEDKLSEFSGDGSRGWRDTWADDMQIGHIMLESVHETGEICL